MSGLGYQVKINFGESVGPSKHLTERLLKIEQFSDFGLWPLAPSSLVLLV
jgi:hypothetical protein